MSETLKLVAAFMLLALAFGGAVVVGGVILSFINRIGNPYDKW